MSLASEPYTPRRPRGIAVALTATVAAAVVVAVLTRIVSGADAWTFETGARATSLVTDGRIVCGAAGDALHCLDGDTGRRRFTRRLGGAALALALVERTLVVGVASEDGTARQLRAYSFDGERLWTVPLREGSVITSPLPVAGDGVVAVVEGPAREPIGIDVRTGDELWRMSAPQERYRVRAVAAPWVFSGSGRFYLTRIADVGCHVAAVDPAAGRVVWRSTRLTDPSLSRDGVSVGCPNVLGAVALERERAIAFAIYGLEDRRLLVLDATDGSRRWHAPMETEGLVRSRHLAHVNDVTVAITDHRMTGFGRDGDHLWTRTIDDDAGLAYLLDHSLVVRNGVLYHAAGGLARIDPHTGERDILVEERTDDGAFRNLADVEFAGDRMIVAGRSVEGLP